MQYITKAVTSEILAQNEIEKAKQQATAEVKFQKASDPPPYYKNRPVINWILSWYHNYSPPTTAAVAEKVATVVEPVTVEAMDSKVGKVTLKPVKSVMDDEDRVSIVVDMMERNQL